MLRSGWRILSTRIGYCSNTNWCRWYRPLGGEGLLTVLCFVWTCQYLRAPFRITKKTLWASVVVQALSRFIPSNLYSSLSTNSFSFKELSETMNAWPDKLSVAVVLREVDSPLYVGNIASLSDDLKSRAAFHKIAPEGVMFYFLVFSWILVKDY